MKRTTILILLSLSTLIAEDNPAPYTRSDTIDTRDKAIQAREKLEASIVDKANNIYSARLEDDVKEKKAETNTTDTPKKEENSNIVSIDDVLNGVR
jgi:hypothetical protein